ncbi:hypothetical protein ACOI1H_12885 [Loktanella sp. DJP18]|uniref:hypothetical protein n=1 Tax=Loktanella sp. DJP18 TaxID=3409788 RepID=UPI003BB7D4A8
MTYVIWGGALLSVVGLCGVLYAVVAVLRAKARGSDDAALRVRVAQMMPVNLASFLLAVLGLMMVVVGVLLA